RSGALGHLAPDAAVLVTGLPPARPRPARIHLDTFAAQVRAVGLPRTGGKIKHGHLLSSGDQPRERYWNANSAPRRPMSASSRITAFGMLTTTPPPPTPTTWPWPAPYSAPVYAGAGDGPVMGTSPGIRAAAWAACPTTP